MLTERTVAADDAGSYQAFAVVPAPAYKNAPSIGSVQNGQTFKSADPVNISGSCPGTSLVEVSRNDVMAGAALCSGGVYQMKIDLLHGTNSLIARAYNSNNIASPDSVPVTVRLAAAAKALGTNGVSFYITADQTYQAAKAGEPLNWNFTINGGQAPYAVSVDWGDGKTDLFSRTAAGTYALSHSYKFASPTGHYTAVVRATDQTGQTVYLQLVAIVRGQVPTLATTTSSSSSQGPSSATMTQVAWVTFGAAGLSLFGFWLGELREARLLGHGLVKI
ncbi:MAG: hypothetical protein JWO41_915 [Candidatus Saccharibacteria bacterium]|nr:hypothetical protein [Candidatus Saccharibacteria bacterium]